MLFGLVYGLNDSDLRLKVMSRLSKHFFFASIVIFNLFSLKVLHLPYVFLYILYFSGWYAEFC